jgi:hypothetical protein
VGLGRCSTHGQILADLRVGTSPRDCDEHLSLPVSEQV